MENLALYLGVISLLISVFAAWLAVSSDRRMKALSNLQFQEKLAVMANHLKNIASDKSSLRAETILNDFEGASHLREYASKDKKEKLIRDYIIPILKIYLNDRADQGLAIAAKGIIDIALPYQIDLNELEKLRQKTRGI
ncbi:MAG TPA: hypothetical protein DCX03_02585 [Bacteroidales bacterium]|jgi:hypothetical protein|nr:hypothetical protein [Bacteroidales bacterium]